MFSIEPRHLELIALCANDPVTFRQRIIDPTLKHLEMYSEAASSLLLGTAIQESRLKYLSQFDNGPAAGFFQVEAFTLQDIQRTYLSRKTEIAAKVTELATDRPLEEQLKTNPVFSCAISRIKYWRDSEPLPDADDICGLARYYKRVYNSALGKATPEEFVANYKRYALGVNDVSV